MKLNKNRGKALRREGYTEIKASSSRYIIAWNQNFVQKGIGVKI